MVTSFGVYVHLMYLHDPHLFIKDFRGAEMTGVTRDVTGPLKQTMTYIL